MLAHDSVVVPSLTQLKLLHLVAQRVAGDAEQAGGLGLVAVGLFERARQQAALVLFQRQAFARESRPWAAEVEAGLGARNGDGQARRR